MKKEKKNKSKVLKIILIAVLVIVLLLILQHVIITLTKKKVTLEKTDATMVVKYTVVDENESKGINNIDDIFDKSITSIIYNSYGFETLKKVGDNYEGTISNANEILKDHIVDYIFAKRNTFGEVISDAKYDSKTKKLTIPKKYFEDENESIQMQVLVKSTSDKIINTKVKAEIKNGTTKEKVQTLNGFDTETTLSIDDYDSNKKIDKDNIDIYVNGKYKVDKNSITYDKSSKTVTTHLNPMLADKIEVVVNKSSILSNVTKIVSADDTFGDATKSGAVQEIKLSGEPKLNETGVWHLKWAYSYDEVNGGLHFFGAYPRKNDYDSKNAYINGNYTASECHSNPRLCPERWVVHNVINNKNYVFGFPGTSMNKENFNTYIPNVTNINLKHDAQTDSTDNDVEFAYRLEPGRFAKGLSFLSTDGKSTNNIDLWVAAYCIHIGNGWVSQTKYSEYADFNYRVLYKDSNSMILQLLFTSADNIGTQQSYGVYKFVWEDNKAKINVNKKLTDNGTDVTNRFDKTGIEFSLYSDSACSNKITSGKTDSNGVATFSDLTLGTYYIKETSLGNLNPNEWSMDNSCTPVTVSSNNSKVGNYYVASINKTNKKKKYCIKLVKKDAYSGQNLSGINFKLSNATTGVEVGKLATNNNGEVVFSNLDYSQNGYWVVEDSGNSSITSPSNTKVKYWNDNGTPTTKKLDLNASLMVNGTCPATTTTYTFNDKPVYYCLKIKKVDKATGEALTGATFTATLGSNSYTAKTDNSGIATFMVGTNEGTYTVTETASPEGYALPANATKQVAATTMSQNTTKDQSTQIGYCNAEVNDAVTYTDSKYLLNWYKDTENKAPAKEAKFKVSIGEESNKKYVKVTDKQNQTDANGVTKSCYVYAGLTSNENEASTLLSDTNGEVCISRVSKGTYTVTETNPSKYHTFGKNANKKINASTVFSTKDLSEDSANNTNRFVNYDTEFEFTKTVSSGDEEDIKIIINGKEKTLKDLTTEELMKLEFNVYDSNNNLVSFILKDGIYEYSENDVDGISGDKLTGLHLDNTRKIKIHHLPVGTYSIKEKNSNTCEASSNYSECVGYYYPEYKEESSYKFTINNCSNSNASACGNGKYEISKQQLENKPTEITFTKKDYYSY